MFIRLHKHKGTKQFENMGQKLIRFSINNLGETKMYPRKQVNDHNKNIFCVVKQKKLRPSHVNTVRHLKKKTKQAN